MDGIRRHTIGQAGFTLLEILISLLIMGMMAGIVVPNTATMLRTTMAAAANSEMVNVATAQLTYYLDHRAWLANSDNLVSANLTAGLPKARYTFDNATITHAEPFDYGRGVWKVIVWNDAIGRWH